MAQKADFLAQNGECLRPCTDKLRYTQQVGRPSSGPTIFAVVLDLRDRKCRVHFKEGNYFEHFVIYAISDINRKVWGRHYYAHKKI
jgi:hypothetical protein